MSIRRLFKLSSQAGDTIVEVMIVLAVLGLAIGISYATANQALKQAREAQENTKATEILQSQIEGIRSLASPTSGQNVFQPGPFCIDTSTMPNQLKLPADATCVPSDVKYGLSISITYNGTAPGPGIKPGGTYTAVATWPSVDGSNTDSVTLTYRYYQP